MGLAVGLGEALSVGDGRRRLGRLGRGRLARVGRGRLARVRRRRLGGVGARLLFTHGHRAVHGVGVVLARVRVGPLDEELDRGGPAGEQVPVAGRPVPGRADRGCARSRSGSTTSPARWARSRPRTGSGSSSMRSRSWDVACTNAAGSARRAPAARHATRSRRCRVIGTSFHHTFAGSPSAIARTPHSCAVRTAAAR